MSPRRGLRDAFSVNRLLALLVAAFVVTAGSAMLMTSTTFDEIMFLAIGARGFHSADFSLAPEHPRLAQYFYGLPVYLSHIAYPAEETLPPGWTVYNYARALLWGAGNNPERLVMLARLVALVFGALTVTATFFGAQRHMGAGAALFAAALVAFLPDMLAHSGIAYNDIPLVFAMVASVYVLDAAVRRPAPARVALAALASALTACVKFSGLVVVPILIVLLALEALSGRWRDPTWRRAIVVATPVYLAVFYAAIALVYLGDWGLTGFSAGVPMFVRGVRTTYAVSFLLGETYAGGKWSFFPVALALKTPIALHVFMLVAAVGVWVASRGGRWRGWMAHGARAPAVGAVLFMAALVTSNFNLGVRHALPMLPLMCILVAQGVQRVWREASLGVRAALAIVFAAFIVSSASRYPYFLSYLNGYVAGRPMHEVLVDSSTDWGQGLVALRQFMREQAIDEVGLGYFGSAPPEGYGIRYVAMPSFMDLAPERAKDALPRYLVVSATLLAGVYLPRDPYAALRKVKPVAIVGGSLYVFDRQALGVP
jgi:Dolichyl-phosphate-mannose-protein mannosyltransferase